VAAGRLTAVVGVVVVVAGAEAFIAVGTAACSIWEFPSIPSCLGAARARGDEPPRLARTAATRTTNMTVVATHAVATRL
jgi:hypothetical protein